MAVTMALLGTGLAPSRSTTHGGGSLGGPAAGPRPQAQRRQCLSWKVPARRGLSGHSHGHGDPGGQRRRGTPSWLIASGAWVTGSRARGKGQRDTGIPRPRRHTPGAHAGGISFPRGASADRNHLLTGDVPSEHSPAGRPVTHWHLGLPGVSTGSPPGVHGGPRALQLEELRGGVGTARPAGLTHRLHSPFIHSLVPQRTSPEPRQSPSSHRAPHSVPRAPRPPQRAPHSASVSPPVPRRLESTRPPCLPTCWGQPPEGRAQPGAQGP